MLLSPTRPNLKSLASTNFATPASRTARPPLRWRLRRWLSGSAAVMVPGSAPVRRIHNGPGGATQSGVAAMRRLRRSRALTSPRIVGWNTHGACGVGRGGLSHADADSALPLPCPAVARSLHAGRPRRAIQPATAEVTRACRPSTVSTPSPTN